MLTKLQAEALVNALDRAADNSGSLFNTDVRREICLLGSRLMKKAETNLLLFATAELAVLRWRHFSGLNTCG